MSELIYIDTNVYLDYWEERADKMRPLGEFAYNVIKRAIDCEFIIVVSDLLIKELKNNINSASVSQIFKDLNTYHKLELIAGLDNEAKEAKELARKRATGTNDAHHAIIAKRAGAKYLVTRNMKDFENLSDLVEPILPENI